MSEYIFENVRLKTTLHGDHVIMINDHLKCNIIKVFI